MALVSHRTSSLESFSGEGPLPRLGRFQPISFLGRGSFGAVFRVKDPLRPEADLALKLLLSAKEERSRPGEAVGRDLLREFQIGSRVRHPVIVPPLETGILRGSEFPESAYLLTEFVPGRPLGPPWEAERLLAVAADLLSALDAIHAAGWRHGDIQPRNILVRTFQPGGAERDEVRLLDFGLAEEIAGKSRRSPTAGTPLYLAPEVLRGMRPDHRADLYSLGVLLYECLRGRIVESLGDHLLRTRDGSFYREVAASGIPEPMKRLISRLLDPEPRSRLESGAAGIAILEGQRGDAGGAAPARRTIPSFEAARLIGREELLGALEDALQSARLKRPSLFFIEGEEGLGKTRAIGEAVAAAFAAGWRSLAWEHAKALAEPNLQEAKQGLSWASPSTSFRSLQRGDPEEVRNEAGARLGAAIIEQVLTEPTLLAVDDVHLHGPFDRAALLALLEKLRSVFEGPSRRGRTRFPPILVLSADPGSTGRPWDRLLDLPWAFRHRLRPWSREEEAEYLDRALPPRHDLGPMKEVLAREAAGNPRRWQLLLRELARCGELRLEGGAWACGRSPSRGTVELPGERERFLEGWKLAPGSAREVLGIASLLGERDSAPGASLLAAVLGREPRAVERTLRELEAGDFVPFSREEAARGEAPLPRLDRRRRAWILREAGQEARRRLRSLLPPAPIDPAEALRHKLRLERVPLKAILDAGAGAGPSSEKLLAFHALRAKAPPRDRARSALLLGEKLLYRGDLPRAGRFLGLAREALQDREGLARAEALLGEIAMARGDLQAARRLLESAAMRAPAGEQARARLLFARGACAFLSREMEEARRIAEEGARGPSHPWAFKDLLGTIALSRGDLEEAERAFRSSIEEALAKGLFLEAGSARTNCGLLHLMRGSLVEAAEFHRKAAKDFQEAGVPSQEALALANLGATLRRSGDYGGAVEAATRSLSIRRETGDDAGVATAEANLAILARELGLPGTAARRFRAALSAAGPNPVAAARLSGNRTFLESRALLALELLDPAEALLILGSEGRSGTAEGDPSSPEGLLIAIRLFFLEDRSESDLVRVLEGRRLEELDAAALAELALGSWLSGKLRKTWPGSALSLRARLELRRLAGDSDRAAFHHHIVELSLAGDAPSREHLRSKVESFAPREGRRSALVALLRTAEPGEGRERFRGLLRLLLDEVIFDLEPETRDVFRRRADIKEALELATTRESGGPAAARTSAALKEIFRFHREILSETREEELVRKILDAAIALTGAERGVLSLRRGGAFRIVAARSGGKDLPDPAGQVSHTILERALSEGASRISTDAREDVTLRSIASVEELGLRSVICVPLRGKRRILGALYLDNPFEKSVFGSEDLELAESFASQAALAWLSAENRRSLEALAEELREANRRLEDKVQLFRRDSEARERGKKKEFCGIVGDSAPLREVFHLVEVIAPTEIPVLITGESGTGKELIARAIHRLSRRSSQPFIAENCAAVPAALLESALFGHVKGAFTGADSSRKGLFEMASGGTLFLDEIAEMPNDLQTRLLRALQEGEVRPIGSQKVLKVDVRVVAATNRDIQESLAQGKFRQDLYFRLQGAEVRLPPLRKRPEDIPLLIERFLEDLREKGHPRKKRLAAETMEKLTRYSWPGNVRELENEIRRLAILAPGSIIGPEFLSPQIREGLAPGHLEAFWGAKEIRPLLEVEREAIRIAMEALKGHRGKVAEALGISRSTLYLKLREMGLSG